MPLFVFFGRYLPFVCAGPVQMACELLLESLKKEVDFAERASLLCEANIQPPSTNLTVSSSSRKRHVGQRLLEESERLQ